VGEGATQVATAMARLLAPQSPPALTAEGVLSARWGAAAGAATVGEGATQVATAMARLLAPQSLPASTAGGALSSGSARSSCRCCGGLSLG